MYILVVTGPSGAGKTITAREIANRWLHSTREEVIRHVSVDRLRDMLIFRTSGLDYAHETEHWLPMLQSLLRSFRESRVEWVVIDGLFPQPEVLNCIHDISRDTMRVVFLSVPLAVCAERNRHRSAEFRLSQAEMNRTYTVPMFCAAQRIELTGKETVVEVVNRVLGV